VRNKTQIALAVFLFDMHDANSNQINATEFSLIQTFITYRSNAHLYRTTSIFLEKLGLDSVEQLPPLAPFLPDDVDEIADAQR